MLVLGGRAIAAAPRLQVNAVFGGERVAGARVCFSRVDSPRPPNVINHLVSGPETRCQPSDRVLSVPAGIWHLYVISDDPYLVSTHPLEIVYSTPSSDAEAINSVTLELVPAATIDVSEAAKRLRPSESLALYVIHRDSDVSAPALVPISPGATEQAVPRRSPVVPLILRGTHLVAVGEELRLETGERGAAEFKTPGTAGLVVPFRIVDGPDLPERPTIKVIHRRSEKLIAEYTPERAEWRGLLFVRDVPAGVLDVIVSGRTIAAGALSLSVPRDSTDLVAASHDLVIERPNAMTTVRWTLDQAFADDVRSGAECPGKPSQPAALRPRLRAFACGGKSVSRQHDLATCTLVHEQVLPDGDGGDMTVPLKSGEIVFELRAGELSTFERAFINDDKPTSVVARLSPAFITGNISMRGQPVTATVRCGGPTQTSHADGHYRCWRPSTAFRFIEVTPCDGSEPYVYEFDPRATTVDVKIPSSELHVSVRDAITDAVIPGARVRLWNGSVAADPEPDSVDLGVTDESGKLRQKRLQPRRAQTICAFMRGYARACREDVETEADADQEITLSLTPATELSGRLVGAAEVIEGRLFVTIGAAVVDEAPVERDGSFRLKRNLPDGVAVVLTSRNLPLCVLDPAPAENGQIRLRIPPLQRKATFTVVSAARRTPVTVELGGILIGSVPFAHHQILRQQQYVVAPAQPLTVYDVDASRGINLVVGAVALPGAPQVDPATLPRHVARDGAVIRLPE
jgi:hypothetical protein